MITPKRLRVLKEIRSWDQYPYGPTIRYIAFALDLSAATIQEHINRLVKDGYVRKREKGNHPRNYRLTYKGKKAMKGGEE